MIKAQISGEKILSVSQEAFSLYEKSRFGEKKQNKIQYSLAEALFLFNKRKLEIYQNSKKLSEDQLNKKAKRIDKKIEQKLTVFSDLRKRGYVVKTGLKFGSDFRVYSKGIKPGQDHAKWLLNILSESEKTNWQDFSAKNRVAHSTKKNLLLAIIDSEDSITYYQVSWIKP